MLERTTGGAAPGTGSVSPLLGLEDLRLAIYRGFATAGRAPAIDTMAAALGTSAEAISTGLRELAQARHLVLDDVGAIVMAHPFAAIPLGFAAMGRATLWWGGCAWDSFALPSLLPDEPEVLVSTTCPGCGRAMAWVVGRDGPPTGTEVAHFLVPVARIWDDVVHACRHQRLFCDRACVDAWLARAGSSLGYVLDLPTLWRLARSWYSGRLERGYVRREPSQARDYFRSVGLQGPFWGL
jgi:hypothetical protein